MYNAEQYRVQSSSKPIPVKSQQKHPVYVPRQPVAVVNQPRPIVQKTRPTSQKTRRHQSKSNNLATTIIAPVPSVIITDNATGSTDCRAPNCNGGCGDDWIVDCAGNCHRASEPSPYIPDCAGVCHRRGTAPQNVIDCAGNCGSVSAPQNYRSFDGSCVSRPATRVELKTSRRTVFMPKNE